jgi:transcriptional regulator with XRE-family HTH domain
MGTKQKTGMDWLKLQMALKGFRNLDELSAATGINKGTISKYFRGIQRPSIDVIPIFCQVFEVSPQELLIALKVMTLP